MQFYIQQISHIRTKVKNKVAVRSVVSGFLPLEETGQFIHEQSLATYSRINFEDVNTLFIFRIFLRSFMGDDKGFHNPKAKHLSSPNLHNTLRNTIDLLFNDNCHLSRFSNNFAPVDGTNRMIIVLCRIYDCSILFFLI